MSALKNKNISKKITRTALSIQIKCMNLPIFQKILLGLHKLYKCMTLPKRVKTIMSALYYKNYLDYLNGKKLHKTY